MLSVYSSALKWAESDENMRKMRNATNFSSSCIVKLRDVYAGRVMEDKQIIAPGVTFLSTPITAIIIANDTRHCDSGLEIPAHTISLAILMLSAHLQASKKFALSTLEL